MKHYLIIICALLWFFSSIAAQTYPIAASPRDTTKPAQRMLGALLDTSVEFESSNLPIIILFTNGLEISTGSRIIATMAVIDNGPGQRNSPFDPPTDYNGNISIKIRGASSMYFPKKSYALETQNAQGENFNISLLGMPKENDWILYAPYSDKTMLRNHLAFKFSSDQGHYAPRIRFCELILNDQYNGVYILMEKIKIDENRVNIARLYPEDIEGDQLTGGYIIEADRNDGPEGWLSREGNFIQYHHPQADNLQQEQKAYIRQYITDFEKVLSGLNYKNDSTGYRAWLDVDAAIDYFLIQEITKNSDAMALSTYMYKDRDSKGGKLVLGPVWDHNLAYGNIFKTNWYTPYDWARDYGLEPTLFWWDRLISDEAFANQFQDRWWELREFVFHPDSINAYIDSMAQLLDEAQQRNFIRWPILDVQVWPNHAVYYTYEGEISQLKDWLGQRIEWLDANMPNAWLEPVSTPDPPPVGEVRVYPNPFSTKVTFFYQIPVDGRVELTIYNVLGKEVQSLVDYNYTQGTYKAVWRGNSNAGKPVSNGIYLYILRSNNKLITTGKITRLSQPVQ